MSNKTIKKLEDLVYRMISFLEDTIQLDNDGVTKGKKIFMKTMFIKEFSDILDKKKDIEAKRREEDILSDEACVINIVMPKSESEEYKIKDEEILDIPKIDEKNKVITGGNPKKIVSINLDNNVEHEPEIDETKIRETKRQKIDRKLKTLNAGEVKKIGQKFKIKPEQGKKYLTKTHVLKKIKNNTKLYKPVLKHINKTYDDLRSESTEN